jgi:outer membrane protein, heavy metal efflux system
LSPLNLSVAAMALAAAALLFGPARAQPGPLAPRPPAVFPEANPPPAVLPAPPARPSPPRREAPPPRRAEPIPPPRPDPEAPPRPPPNGRPAAGEAPRPEAAAALARDLDAAMALDAAARGLAAQRDAVRARDALVRSPIPGSPVVGGSLRSDLRGPDRARELDLEFAAPIWLPGQRSALAGTVEAGVAEAERRLALRRLEVAGLLRDAYWAVGEAESDRRVARDRLATARDIARDFGRRAELGDVSGTEALLGRNEVLAAELELSRADAAAELARTAYRTLTGGAAAALPAPDGPTAAGGMAGARPEPTPPLPRAAAAAPAAAGHPALRAAEAAVAAAEARARLVAATPRDNPEVGIFGRGQGGPVTEEGVSMGLRLRLPLATEARNAPRRADAEAERTRAVAELAQTVRVLEGEVARARTGLAAADTARRLAAERRGVADRQLAAARIAFASGEIGAFDLFRVRQLQLEAAAEDARAAVALGRARSRLNQALGVAPGEDAGAPGPMSGRGGMASPLASPAAAPGSVAGAPPRAGPARPRAGSW